MKTKRRVSTKIGPNDGRLIVYALGELFLYISLLFFLLTNLLLCVSLWPLCITTTSISRRNSKKQSASKGHTTEDSRVQACNASRTGYASKTASNDVNRARDASDASRTSHTTPHHPLRTQWQQQGPWLHAWQSPHPLHSTELKRRFTVWFVGILFFALLFFFPYRLRVRPPLPPS